MIRCYHRILDLRHSHLDVQVLRILTGAIINNINDADGLPAIRLLHKSLELLGRLSSNICNNADIWIMYAQLTALKKTDVDEEKATQYLQQAHRVAISNPKWFSAEDTTLNVLELCCILAKAYLSCITNVTTVKKRKMLGSAKLSLQGVIKKVEEQQWNNLDIIEQSKRVEEYLTTVTNELERIQSNS